MSSLDFPNACILQRHQTRPVWRSFLSLFQKLTLLKILPNFESSKDRFDSSELCKYQACFDKLGVAMVGISDQPTGSNEFIKHTNWKGELFLDMNHEVCLKATDCSTKNFLERQKFKFNSHFNQKRNHPNTLFKLGGTHIVTSDFQVIYAHEPKSGLDSPSVGFILNLCRSYMEASKSMNSPQPVFAPISPSLRPNLRSWNSSETILSYASSSSPRVTSSQFYLNNDFSSIFG
ncbi:hypothetical protein DSO57_1003904 [Entomophthora muscae]|uniref:Uncharacterized protein n=1 Tax=Entomophthora muscae TaxID=34485 RepID=A0ACC2SA64_9FUNG|nr:hypothetical protein DSO57_1003904 [Entomophthora muscae]